MDVEFGRIDSEWTLVRCWGGRKVEREKVDRQAGRLR